MLFPVLSQSFSSANLGLIKLTLFSFHTISQVHPSIAADLPVNIYWEAVFLMIDMSDIYFVGG